jgi:Ni/Co efflux regulator RcnB
MIRKKTTLLLLALVAVFAFGSMAEAAPKRTVHHRAKHSSRVQAGATTTRKKTVTRKSASGGVTKTTKKTVRKPSTKPR